MTDSNERLHAIVHGIVQGVSFRYYTTEKARDFKLTGWVMNRRDRTVEVVAEGSRENLEALQRWLHDGSPSAQVERVDVTWESATDEFTVFQTKYYLD
ncbi:MAG: acylphosphatase [Anaerolineae bacterium]|nr:acylphosphatase [Anaerolineae bacterium]